MDFSTADAVLVFSILFGMIGALFGSAFGATKVFLKVLPSVVMMLHRSVVWTVNAIRAYLTQQSQSADVESIPEPVEFDSRWDSYDEPTYVRKGIMVSVG
ncbi:hypothetical protein DFO67_11556 [Modicisalibacter xianhensis]|uniref:Uncharacterized protein n=1 Tax=Modicisalibacter xianhensis TaxID=442341 RepID=A0A4R8FW41_9GAMM|nr:hypothetical protein [Halomonas xianhensis]TDX26791.1 hypothetical protein DFO67_11556 [Halomonas xianhensis]